MHGSLSITSAPGRSSSLASVEAVERFLACAAVGVLAGIAAAHVRLHLGLPGHKALLWMVPVIAARLVFPSMAGATAGAVSAALATLAAGGNLAGDAMGFPIVGLAGMMLDAAVGLAERRRLRAAWRIPLVGFAALVANLVMLGKRLASPLFASHQVLWSTGLEARLISYAVFGLASGLLAATLAHFVLRGRALRAGGD